MRIGNGLRMTIKKDRRPSTKNQSLSDSSASTSSWNVENITGATNKVPDTSVVVPEANRSTFSRIVGTVWNTRFTDDNKDSNAIIKTTLRELIIYIVFLILLCIVTFGMASPDQYYFTNLMANIFVLNSPNSDAPAFVNLAIMSDIWAFMLQGALMTYLYPSQWYNGQNFSSSDFGYILHENRLLGAARLRQVRVKNDSCVVPDDFQNYINACYDSYSSRDEDTSPFGLKNGTAWTFQDDPSLMSVGSGFSGKVSSYGTDGYYQVLPSTFEASTEVITNLENNRWIDRGSRAVFIDFTIYNANINLFCVVRLVAELPSTGGVVPSYDLRTVKLIRYVTPGDYFVLACEIFIVIFLVYYTIEEFLEIKKHRLSYLKSFWNILDLIMLVLAYCCMGFDIYRSSSVGSQLDQLLKDPESYPDFTFLSYWQLVFNTSIACLVFCAWVKLFKYISFNKTMTQLSSTVSRCAGDLAGFAVMFFIFFIAFTQLGYLLFGSQVQAYCTMTQSFFSLFRTILGDFDFDSLQQASPALGPAYFIFYIFMVFFILLNMFLAIINDTYAEVKEELQHQKNEIEMGDYFRHGASKVLEKMNLKKDRVTDITDVVNFGDINCDGILEYDEYRSQMKQRGYADAEIEAVFSKYDVNGDRALDAEERRRMLAELGEHSESDGQSEEKEEGGISSEELTAIKERVESVEKSVDGVLSKIESVLTKLDFKDKRQTKRRETLIKLLNSLVQTGVKADDQSRQELIRLIRDELINESDS